jgi:Fe-S oxidoreductase
MDDRTLFRYKADYKVERVARALDWSEWGGFDKAVEMCNNNGFCRKFDAGTMCPSYRATGDEQHATRGRANALRLAISGQLGPDAFTSDELYETMDLCVACKGCRRECPTGVDMAKMKIEFLHHYRKRHGLRLKDWLVGYLPRYAGVATRLRWLLSLRDAIPGAAKLSEKLLGFTARRRMPRWQKPFLKGRSEDLGGGHINGEVVLLVDCFNNNLEPENARAAVAVLRAAGYLVHLPHAEDGDRPLCCGRTFLSAGLVDQAKAEARRTLKALLPFAARGVPVIGLEPSCLLTLRDEFISLLPDLDTGTLALNALLFEEFLAREASAGRLQLKLKPLAQKKALLHGHCHQKAFGAMPAVQQTLRLIPGLEVEVIESSCCGMAGSFGFEPQHYDISMKMAEANLLPKVRSADGDTLIVADGTSCRQQIHDGARRDALHVARVLEQALDAR